MIEILTDSTFTDTNMVKVSKGVNKPTISIFFIEK